MHLEKYRGFSQSYTITQIHPVCGPQGKAMGIYAAMTAKGESDKRKFRQAYWYGLRHDPQNGNNDTFA